MDFLLLPRLCICRVYFMARNSRYDSKQPPHITGWIPSLNILFYLLLAISTLHPAISVQAATEGKLLFRAELLPLSPDISPDTGNPETSSKALPTVTGASIAEPNPESANPAATALARSQDINAYRQSIQSRELEEGPYSYTLSEELLSLGLALQANGEHTSALEELDRAMHIVRVNEGLYTPGQLGHINHKIKSLYALDDHQTIHDLKAYSFNIMFRNYPVTSQEFADTVTEWNRWKVREFLAQPYPGTINYQLSDDNLDFVVDSMRNNPELAMEPYNDPTLNGSLSTRGYNYTDLSMAGGQNQIQRNINARLRKAENTYDAIFEQLELMQDDASFTIGALRNQQLAAREFARLAYAVKTHLDMMEAKYASQTRGFTSIYSSNNPDNVITQTYNKGRKILQHTLQLYLQYPEATYTDIFSAYMDLADWQLAFNRSRSANETYLEAISYLSEQGLSEPEISQLIQLPATQAVPVFSPDYYSEELWKPFAEIQIEYKEYYDVSFNKDRYGNIKDIQITGSSENASNTARDELLDHLRSIKLRPSFIENETVEERNLHVRYFYTFY